MSNTKSKPPSNTLADGHRRELEYGSGITPGIIEQRGYATIVDPSALLALGFSEEQALRVPGLLIPLHSVDGEVILHQFKPEAPRMVDGKPIKYETPLGARMRLDVHPAVSKDVRDVERPLVITEGLKKSDCLVSRGHAVIGLLGVWNFSGANDSGGICELADWATIPFKSKNKGRTVYIVFDSDIVDKPGVRGAAIKLAQLCRRRGAGEVHAIRIPSKGDEKIGVDDFFVQGGLSEDLFNSIDDNLLRNDMIRVDGRPIADIAADAMAALTAYNSPPRIFVRSGEIVSIQTDERGNSRLATLGTTEIRGVLGRASSWCQLKNKSLAEILCPRDIAEDFAHLREWPDLPAISTITKGPVLAGDSIAKAPGYCPEAKVWIDGLPVKDFPGTAKHAVGFLRKEVLGTFPFATEADFAHALALMLLPIVRSAVDGPTPLHLIGAPVQGSGKTLLGKACLMVTQGNRIAVTPMGSNEENTRKLLTSAILEGASYIFLDNLVHRVDSESLSAMLTSGTWTDRRLGATSMLTLDVNQTLVATANNPNLGWDTVRRSVRIWIDAGVERPEDRQGFKPLERYIREHRPEIQGALCKMVEEWLSASRPKFQGRTIGSYESWAEVLGGILLVCGVPGFLDNVMELRESAGRSEASWAGFYERWAIKHNGPVLARDVMELFTSDDELSALLGDHGDSSRRLNFAQLLRQRVGVVCGGFTIIREAKRLAGAQYYRLVDNEQRRAMQGLLDLEQPNTEPVRI